MNRIFQQVQHDLPDHILVGIQQQLFRLYPDTYIECPVGRIMADQRNDAFKKGRT